MKLNQTVLIGSGALLCLGTATWWEVSRPLPESSPAKTIPVLATGNPARRPTPAVIAVSPKQAETPTRVSAEGEQFKRWVAQQSPEVYRAMETLLPSWVATDPQAALTFADNLEFGPRREMILHRVVQLWSRQNLPAALKWAKESPDALEARSLERAICKEQVLANGLEAVTTAKQLGFDRDNPEFIQYLVGEWASTDRTGAMNWIHTLPKGPERNDLLSSAAQTIAQKSGDPGEAADMVLTEIPEGSQQNDAVIAVLRIWAQRDYREAAEWVESFPPGLLLRGRAYTELEAIDRGRKILQASNRP